MDKERAGAFIVKLITAYMKCPQSGLQTEFETPNSADGVCYGILPRRDGTGLLATREEENCFRKDPSGK